MQLNLFEVDSFSRRVGDGFYRVQEIETHACKDLILNVHYARRWPSISYSYGLFLDGALVGCVTFGSPAGSPIRVGLVGVELSKCVIELNRLCIINNKKNQATFLISSALKLLRRKGEFIVISYADPTQGHTGIVYQAANFIYFGLTEKRTDWAVKGKEHLHGQTVADEFRGVKDRAAAMRKKYKNDFYLKPRAIKHRYVSIVGSKKFKKFAKKSIKYEVKPYPKEQVK